MNTENIEIKVGTVIEYFLNDKWIESTVTRVSASFVWFKGSGYERIKRTTFVNYPELFRIKK